MSAGPGAGPGVEIVVGMPFGVDTPGRPPRIPPVPGKLRNEPPPDPGAAPRRELSEPGSVGTLVSTVGPCATARSANIEEADRERRGSQSVRISSPSMMAVREPTGAVAKPIFRFNPGLEPTGRAPLQSVTSLDSPRPQ